MPTETLNAWALLPFYDPVPVLKNLHALEIVVTGYRLAPNIRRLRTNPLNDERHARNAAIFTHWMASVIGTKVYFARQEAEDYDLVTSWVLRDEPRYCPVQLKELVPTDLNPIASLEAVLSSLQKYPPTKTVVAILLNRPAEMTGADLRRFKIPFAQAWLFWRASRDGKQWAIQGDIVIHPVRYDFFYPE